MFRIFLYSSPEWIDRQFELMRKGAERDALREYPREHQRALRLMRTAQIIDESVGHDPVAARKEMTAPAWTMRTIVTYIAHLFTRKEQAVSMPKAVVRPPAPSGEHRRTDPA